MPGACASCARPSFAAYLRRTVINLCISHFRRERTARAYVSRASMARSAGREPATALPDIETRDEVPTALAELPARQRAAVILRFYADLNEDQVPATPSVAPSGPRAPSCSERWRHFAAGWEARNSERRGT